MPINIKMKPGFMYWGTTVNSLTLEIPFPSSGTFETSFKAKMQESSDGSIVAQLIGRSRDKQTLSWEIMDCTKWWEINNYLEENGVFIYCRYFNFNRGMWTTKKFYVESPSCEPYRPGAKDTVNYGQPRFLRNCQIVVNDMGEVS